MARHGSLLAGYLNTVVGAGLWPTTRHERVLRCYSYAGGF
jgi:hypothetical protein